MQAPTVRVPAAEPLLILGASARAAASSARRAGYQPWAADMFGDTDLSSDRPCCLVRDYPGGLARAARGFPAAAWMYTGALENHPELVDRIGADRPLLGNHGPVLRRVRDPFQVASALQAAGWAAPEVVRTAAEAGLGAWLCKPRHSCGGDRIKRLDVSPKGPLESTRCTTVGPASEPDSPENVPNQAATSGVYYQRFIAGGNACGAVFLAARGRAVLLGTTRQLIGETRVGAAEFRYSGSIGPLSLEPAVEATLRGMGDCLAASFGLTGLFGVDAILVEQNVWPVEVNPRYTASVEILERALDFPALRWHVQACRDGELPATPFAVPRCQSGKEIVYARCDIGIPAEFVEFATACNADRAWPSLADIPPVGARIARDQPVVTVLAEGQDLETVQQQLRRQVERVQAILGC